MNQNTELQARKWVEFLARRHEFPSGQKLLDAFRVGTLTRLCDCGCNSFDIDVPANAGIAPLSTPGEGGAVFEMDFEVGQNKTIELIVHVSENGHLSALEVDYCGNSYPMPEMPEITGTPYHVWASASLRAV